MNFADYLNATRSAYRPGDFLFACVASGEDWTRAQKGLQSMVETIINSDGEWTEKVELIHKLANLSWFK